MHRTVRLSLALSLVLFLLGFQAAFADEVVIHTVRPGENLFRIGLQYGVPWPEIMQANGLTGTTIYVGQQLIIPTVAGAAPAQPAPPQPSPTLADPHTVARGETLLTIAARYGVSWQAIARANNLPNPNLIFTGQQLLIPGTAGTPVSPPTAPGGPAIPDRGQKKIVVDISEQHLYAYQGEILVFSFVASTGLPGLDTLPGSYHVQSKITNAYGGNWNIWMPHWLGIYWAGSLENGIHALPILPGGARLWAGYLGQPISYGCVVLGVWEAEQLWNWAAIGDQVIIRP